MRLYRVEWHDKDDGQCYAWYATKVEAIGGQKLVKDEYSNLPKYARPDVTINAVVISAATPAGLARWLTIYFNRDNG